MKEKNGFNIPPPAQLEVNKREFHSKEHTGSKSRDCGLAPQSGPLILLTRSAHPIGPECRHLLCACLFRMFVLVCK